jgi:hypothetical protein
VIINPGIMFMFVRCGPHVHDYGEHAHNYGRHAHTNHDFGAHVHDMVSMIIIVVGMLIHDGCSSFR